MSEEAFAIRDKIHAMGRDLNRLYQDLGMKCFILVMNIPPTEEDMEDYRILGEHYRSSNQTTKRDEG